ncbi:nuclease-related domain-containing protein [Paramicrobacterium fandaimingii]|uniref:nuclease-related domain-containing protein n=1 Tax=Paramicrobacterium fandaimingii TaxID=2708079 RepID=UPI0014230A3E|nr:nuclease-related domain-containing protein [Microbacterium fandaimingii]
MGIAKVSAGQSAGSDLVKTFGIDGRIGEGGERYFDDMLRRRGFANRFEVFHALQMPTTARGQKQLDTDIDFAIASGNNIVLIDVKRWAADYVYWSLWGRPVKGMNPMHKDGEWGLSQNMAIARARFRSLFPGVNVYALVIFVPTSQRALPRSVSFFRWPGGIRSYLLDDGLNRVTELLGAPRPALPVIVSTLSQLKKH